MAALLTAATTDTTSSEIDYTAATTITVSGLLGNAKVALDISDDAGTSWTTPHLFTDNASPLTLNLDGTFKFRVRLIGSTAATSVTVRYGGDA